MIGFIIASIVIVLIIFQIIISNEIFKFKVIKEVIEMYENIDISDKIITEEDIKDLPDIVQKWIRRCGFIGKQHISSIRFKQKGAIRTKEDAKWMNLTADQYYRTDKPSFIWFAHVKYLGLFLKGRDKYINHHGNMLIKLLALFKVVDAKGKEMDQGTLVRYLNEMMWFPSAAISDYIAWEKVDSNSAKATITDGSISASATFYFNDDGDLIDFKAQRYGDFDGGFKLETWSTPITEYKNYNGYRLPSKGYARWELDSGDFTYIKLELLEIEYNNPNVY